MTTVTSKKKSKYSNRQQPNETTIADTNDSQGKLRQVTLRNQLLQKLLPAVLLPVAIGCFVAYHAIHQNAEEELQTNLRNQNLLASEEIGNLLEYRLQAIATISQNPLIIDAARNSTQVAKAQNLSEQSIATVEKRFDKIKLLLPQQRLNDYLRNVAKSMQLGELFFTDSNGFNVAYDRPTSDFIQKDETWWQKSKSQTSWIGTPALDRSSNIYGFELAQAIKDPETGNFLGVVKALLPIAQTEALEKLIKINGLTREMQLQLLDPNKSEVIQAFATEKAIAPTDPIGGQVIVQVANRLSQASNDPNFVAENLKEQLKSDFSVEELRVTPTDTSNGSRIISAYFFDRDREYSLSTIPKTNLVVVASIAHQEVESAGREWLYVFAGTTLALLALTTGAIFLLARQLSKPLKNLAEVAERAAAGNLNVVAQPSGTIETQTLARSFNKLVTQVKSSIDEQSQSLEELEQARQRAEILAEEQRLKSENIQRELLNLLGDIEGAQAGDLTVRSQISAGEIGIVADFFNSIVENLRDIVVKVKTAATKVNGLVGKNQDEIGQLAAEAIAQTNQITQTLEAVEQMSRSIAEVANNAKIAAEVSRNASAVAETGGAAMEKTVASILQLRETIAHTAKKVKRLGESSQQIAKIISLIDQIAMQTNLLAINASIEAARAGEEGRGFAVVAEEVGELAAQSSEATKEIEMVVENIQKETAEVVKAMEIGTAQVVEGTRLVKDTKKNLEQIVAVSVQIDRLLQSISAATVSQTQTSQTVTNLMQTIAKASERTSDASVEVTSSLSETVEIAKQLQASVETFKVDSEA
ncbi:MAG: methyl-accepting chemotaxis protein [Xenococcaceae cyanobacterium]